MTESDSQYAYFTITGSFDPLEITKLVGVEPTRAWREGDEHPKSPANYKFSRWSLNSKLSESECIEKHIIDVLDQLDENEEQFIHICKLYDGAMQVVGQFYESYPGWHLDSFTILRLAKYSLHFDFDFYEYYSEETDDTLN